MYRSSPKKVRVSPSVAKPGMSVISNPAAKHAQFPAAQKRESHLPSLSDQSFGDEPDQLRTDDHSRAAKSREMQKQVESYDNKSTGNVHTFGYVPRLSHTNDSFIF